MSMWGGCATSSAPPENKSRPSLASVTDSPSRDLPRRALRSTSSHRCYFLGELLPREIIALHSRYKGARRLNPGGRMVPYVLRRDHEDDVLGDIRRMIADPLKVARDEDEIERRLDGRRILQHIGEEFPKDLTLERVELIVGVQDRLRE